MQTLPEWAAQLTATLVHSQDTRRALSTEAAEEIYGGRTQLYQLKFRLDSGAYYKNP